MGLLSLERRQSEELSLHPERVGLHTGSSAAFLPYGVSGDRKCRGGRDGFTATVGWREDPAIGSHPGLGDMGGSLPEIGKVEVR